MKRKLLLASRLLLVLCLLLPAAAWADCPVTITGGDGSGAYTWNENDRILTIQGNARIIEDGGTDADYRIVVEDNVQTLTLDADVMPKSGCPLTVRGDLTLTITGKKQSCRILSGEHDVPVIQIADGHTLTINGDKNLEVSFDSSAESKAQGASAIVGNLAFEGSGSMGVMGAPGQTGGQGIAGDVTVCGPGKLLIHGGQGTNGGNGIVGAVRVSQGRLVVDAIAGGNGIVGSLMMTGGVVICDAGAGSKGGSGIVLTGNSSVVGKDPENIPILEVEGSNDDAIGQPAIRRENGAVLSIEGPCNVFLRGGAHYNKSLATPKPDYSMGYSPALSSVDMLVWKSTAMFGADGKGTVESFTNIQLALEPSELEGKSWVLGVPGYDITYDANSGEGEMEPGIVVDREKVATGDLEDESIFPDLASIFNPYTIKNCEFTRTGHSFLGWQVIMGGEEKKYEPQIVVTADTTIRALWKPLTYTITFDTDGGSAVASITQDYGSTVTAPANPTKDGYTFTGWVDRDGALVSFPLSMPENGLTLTATWKLNQTAMERYSVYGVTHYLEQADGSYSEAAEDTQFPLSGKVGETVTAQAKAYPGYTLNEAKSIDSATLAQAEPDAQGQPVYTKLELYYDLNAYTIAFDTDGGSAVASITQKYATPVTAPANPTKDGCTFLGWEPAVPAVMPLDGLTVKAKWQAVDQPGESMAIKTAIHEKYTDADIPQTLRNKGLDTVEKIKLTLMAKAEALPGELIDAQLYDVVLMYSVDNGKNWIRADETHFPKDGRLYVQLPVPENTDPLTHQYHVIHLFTSDAFGKTPGDMEYPEVSIVDDGNGRLMLSFYVTGLSPILVSWMAEELPAGQLPQTGDRSSMALWLFALGACGAALLLRRRREN